MSFKLPIKCMLMRELGHFIKVRLPAVFLSWALMCMD